MSLEEVHESILFNNSHWAQVLFGPQNRNLRVFERSFDVKLNTRGHELKLSGSADDIKAITAIVEKLRELFEQGHSVHQMDIVNAIRLEKNGELHQLIAMYEQELIKNFEGQPIRVRTIGQKHYTEAVAKNDVVFGIGPAGTGKTFLAVAMAVAAMKRGEVKRIILTRPAVEAGESLGFLPGDLREKVDPYLRPLYDSLHTILGSEQLGRLLEREVIEIAPLAYMRGRTLDQSFVILDEAQNTTVPQMKMFLTRLGFDSKMVVNGDKTQIDLPRGITSGLKHAEYTLRDVPGIGHVAFTSEDVIRHPLVSLIIDAYEDVDAQQRHSRQSDE